jgi:metal-dependent amidase/aminoacylase/carboxypeptidase family protein
MEIQACIREKSVELLDKINSYREHLHAHPELSFEEFETSNFVSSKLTELGVTNQKIGNTGVVGLIM